MSSIALFDKSIHTKSKRILALAQYWEQIKGEKAMPMRADFNPMAVPALLPFLFVDDVFHDPIRFRFRLVGTEIVNGIGSDPTGKDRVRNEADTDSWDRLTKTVEEKKPIIGLDCYYKSKERYHTDYECIHLPFSEDGENVTMIMSLSTLRRF